MSVVTIDPRQDSIRPVEATAVEAIHPPSGPPSDGRVSSTPSSTADTAVVYATAVPSSTGSDSWFVPESSGGQQNSGIWATVESFTRGGGPMFASVTPATAHPDGDDDVEGGEGGGGGVSGLERDQALIGLYRMCRIVRIVAALDILFIVAFGIILPVFFIIVPFPICGYLGARWYSHRFLFVYAVYLGMEIIGCFVSVYFVTSSVFIVLRLIYLIINMVIMRMVMRMAGYFKVMSPEDFEFLKTSPVIADYNRGRICF